MIGNTYTPEIEETKRQGILVKENETPEEQSVRLRKLELIWDPESRATKRECSFFQYLLDKEYAGRGETAPNLYPEILANETRSHES